MKKAIYTQKSEVLRKFLADSRKSQNLSIRDLAKKLSIHSSIVGKIETGERQLNIIEFIEYCQTLEADPIEIINKLNSV